MSFPVLILLTDGFPNANGAGISQTLYNLLNNYDGGIVIFQGQSEKLPSEHLRLQAKLVSYPDHRWRGYSRRPFCWLNGIIERLRMQWLFKVSLCSSCLPSVQSSAVLISTTVPEKLMLAWRLQKEYGYTVLPYFMDDWLAGNNLQWKGGNIHQVARDLLANAPAWLMISENLKQVLMQRYQLAEKPCLIVHNPAPSVDSGLPIGIGMTPDSYRDDSGVTGDNDVNGPYRQPSTLPAGRQASTVNSQLIIYAGSIWPMHADALAAVAKAIHLLHQQGHSQYSLRLYVPASHWQQYQVELQGPGVEYAGWVPYAQLQEILRPAWLTLCTASFLPAHQAFSFSSVQTKLTDYMAAGKPILYVGPANGASGDFVARWDCGFIHNRAEAAAIAELLQSIAGSNELYSRKAAAAYNCANSKFSQATVQALLHSFLASIQPEDKKRIHLAAMD